MPTNPAVRTVPAYASSCGDDAAYRSACSGNGQPSTVLTYTATPTTTGPSGPCATFVLKALTGTRVGAYLGAPFQDYNLQFMSKNQAQRFILQGTRLVDPFLTEAYANTLKNIAYGIEVSQPNADNVGALACIVPGMGIAITCTLEGSTNHVFEYNANSGIVFSPQLDNGYTEFQVGTEAAC